MSDQNQSMSIAQRLALKQAGGNAGAPASLPQNPSNKDDPTTLAPESEKKITEDQVAHVTKSGLTPAQQIDSSNLNQIKTGMEGSVEPGVAPISKAVRPLEPMGLANAQYKEGSYPEGSYRALKQRQIILGNGTVVKADSNGYFVPESQEEADLLNYFATKRFGLVEKV